MQMCPDNANNHGKKSPFTKDIFGFLLNALRRFFLKRMDHPKIVSDLYRIDHPESIASKGQRDFKDTRPKPLHWLGYSCLAALSSKAQCIKHDLTRTFGKALESFARRCEP